MLPTNDFGRDCFGRQAYKKVVYCTKVATFVD